MILIDVLDEENSLYFVDTSHSLIEDNQEILKLAKEILKDNEFRLIILHTIEGLSLVEIAKSLNKNESTIRWQYNNGLKKLRKELERRNK
ncbi:MAG: RNA polymerase sigma factor [Christensenellales bacterium]